MKKNLSLSVLSLLLIGCCISSCTKEKHEDVTTQGQIAFTFSDNAFNSNLKSANDSVASLCWVVVTVEDAAGNVVKNSEKVELYNMNGNYISQPLSLLTGNYKLTRFLVLDCKNNIVYAAPKKGSPKASLVQTPLPISFEIKLNSVTKITPQVLSTVESTPEDFGYATFGFDVVTTFDFLVGTFIYNETVKKFELTTADISIVSGSSNPLGIVTIYDSIGVTNKITLPELYNNYTLIISKHGYKTYNQTFTKEELKLHLKSSDKGPLVVILDKSTLTDGLIAYYRFNGSAIDESGNGHNGNINGIAKYTPDRNGNINSAIDFTNNSSVSATIGRLGSTTVSAWIKMPAPTTWYPTIIEYLPDNMSLNKGVFFIHVLGNIYPSAEQGKLYYGLYNDKLNIQTRDDESTPSPLAYDVWNHIVFNYDSITQIAKMYVNSALVTSEACTNSLHNQNLTQITIGRCLIHNPSKPTNFAGSIDELLIYNRALSNEEIVCLYQLQ